jgi:hypothetical protein
MVTKFVKNMSKDPMPYFKFNNYYDFVATKPALQFHDIDIYGTFWQHKSWLSGLKATQIGGAQLYFRRPVAAVKKRKMTSDELDSVYQGTTTLPITQKLRRENSEVRVDPKVDEGKNGFRFWIAQSM